MKTFFIIFLNLIFSIFSILPTWDLKKSSIDLLGTEPNTNKEYIIANRVMYELTLTLKKNITRNNGKISHQNYLNISGKTLINNLEVSYENVESFYGESQSSSPQIYILCPRGNFNPINLTNLENISFNNWINSENWDLKCYYHSTGFFLIFYFMNGKYQSKVRQDGSSDWKDYNNLTFYDEIYDFKLKNGNTQQSTYPFIGLIKDNSYIKLYGANFQFGSDIVRSHEKTINLTESKKYTQGYFNNETTDFYYMTYNNISDFISGYSESKVNDNYEIQNDFKFINNEKSPFEFMDEVEIKEMNFFPYNKYVYYSIYNKNTSKYYHGILDVKLNKIMFNTDEQIDVFIPYSQNAMLAITNESAYKICAIQSGDSCVEECTTGSSIILGINGNICGSSCTNGYLKLIPEEVCIPECDLSIFVKNDSYCGLCRDMYSDKKYKLINGTECLSNIPEGYEVYNENLGLLVCKSGYIFNNSVCVPHCYNTCEICTEYSTDEANQHCLNCTDGYYLGDDSNCHKIIVYSNCTGVNQIKCEKCNERSNELELCIECKDDFKKVNYTTLHPEFIDCLKKDDPILNRFYFNETAQEYRPCYKTCKRCLMAGDAEANNCLECISGYMLRPVNNPKNNCIAYSEYYYISSYDQIKSLNVFQCPEEAKYMIKEKKSCIDDCKKDPEYKFLYNGVCLKECPSGTVDNSNFICIEESSNCHLGQNDLNLENNNLGVVTTLVKTYISEFNYTSKHVSLYKNVNYTVIIYKTASCIKELNIEMPTIDFKSCYEKVQNAYNIHEDLVISVVDKKEINSAVTFYSFFHPKSGEKLDAATICKDVKIEVKENLDSFLDESSEFYTTQTSLTGQGINIFDPNDPFYTDICFDFDNPLKKDIPLNDRMKDLFPNATLCDKGCTNTGINLADMTATCDCSFNDITKNALIQDNEFLNDVMGDVFDIINSSNILVLKCFKYMFTHFSRSIGGWISLILICAQIAMCLLYFFKELGIMKFKILNLTKKFLEYNSRKEKKVQTDFPPRKPRDIRNNKFRIKSNNDIIISSAINKNNNNLSKQSSDININNKLIDSKKKDDVKTVIFGSTKELNRISNLNNNINNNSNSNSNNININSNINNIVDEKGDTQNNLNTQTYDDTFFEEYLAESPDDMDFDDAYVYDKRTFKEHFLENLKEKQIIAHTFIANDLLKPRTMKIIVLILSFLLYFVVNGLFFSESVISELYELDEDEEHFFSYFPRSISRIIYCTIVSIVVDMIVDFFFVQEIKLKKILIKEKDNPNTLKMKIVELIKDIKKRNIAFIATSSVILLFSFFYLLCFNYVYPYSQIEWIKSSITIFILMQILYFLKCFLQSGLRFLSFKINSEKLYKISRLFD